MATFSRQVRRTVDTTSREVVEFNVARKALVFFPPNATNLFISLKEPAVVSEGYNLLTSKEALPLSKALHGDMVMGPFHAVASAAGVIFYWESTSTDED